MNGNQQDVVTMLAMKVVAQELEVTEFLADGRVQARILRVGQAFSRKYPKSQTYNDGREIAQQINCRLAQNFTFKGCNGCSFETFIRHMAQSLCIDDHRKRTTRNETELSEKEQSFPTFVRRLDLETEIAWYFKNCRADEEVIRLWIRTKIGLEQKLTLQQIADRAGIKSRKTVAQKIDKFLKEMQLRLGPPPNNSKAASAAAPR